MDMLCARSRILLFLNLSKHNDKLFVVISQGGGGKRYKKTDLYIIICPAAMAKKDHTNTHTNISPKSNQSPQYTTEQNCR